jgi:CDP-2,3-bis-(O-geranylgeranyl)-sn-glycerol synthase
MDPLLLAKLLFLLLAANGAPILARRVLGARWDTAIDGGRLLGDRQPLFGPAKTWRGIIAALLITPLLAALLGLPPLLGALVAVLAMFGDLLSSFTKRRLRITPSSMALGLDQIPEALLPLLACRQYLGMDWGTVVLLVALFLILELLLSRLLYRLNIRRQPY